MIMQESGLPAAMFWRLSAFEMHNPCSYQQLLGQGDPNSLGFFPDGAPLAYISKLVPCFHQKTDWFTFDFYC
jgi:hypothetical protein